MRVSKFASKFNSFALLSLAVCVCFILECFRSTKYMIYFKKDTFTSLNIDKSEQHEISLVEDKFKRITYASYAYTAYVDQSNRNRRLMITGATDRQEKLNDFVCKITYRRPNGSTVVATERGHTKLIPDDHGQRYIACLYICKLTREASVPIRVSIKANKKDALPNAFDVTPPEKANRSFTVCLQPLHGDPSPQRLVEWFEFLRILAANRVVVYIGGNITQNVDKVLQFYRKRGFVQIVPFVLPNRIRRKIHNYGQLLALNDCLYRNKHDTKYIVSSDYDEFLIPKDGSYDWSSLMNNFSQKNVCEYIVRTSMVPIMEEYQKQFKEQKDTSAKHFKLITMLNFVRDPFIFNPGIRSKYFVLSHCAEVIGIHNTHRFAHKMTQNKTYVFHPREALGYHFRNRYIRGKPKGAVHDTYLLKYREELIKNINRTWSDIGQ